MDIFDSVLLGALEGLTEFLPISSTGHLILASHLLSLPQTPYLKTFEITIQLGSIAAVALLYWKQFLNFNMLLKLAVAFIPTGLVGLFLYPFIKETLVGNPAIVVVALIIGGIALLGIEKIYKAPKEETEDPTSLSFKQSFIVGCAQALAVIPGVSRSGATISGGMLLGISRGAILSFSFLLAVPTMFIATAYDLYKNPDVLVGANLPPLVIGFLVAFVVGLVVIRYALRFVRKYTFVPFAIYRIILGMLFWLIVL
ncbi:MAG TPA: undecaprenyl-diphosphatase UppP [Candidatus Paceibacterota bacterium]|nr:undecaprenyl-diphosphatase UppP [Candidatus Paceibacterota bacterium]